jgi:hypothetical protein
LIHWYSGYENTGANTAIRWNFCRTTGLRTSQAMMARSARMAALSECRNAWTT